jgi:hypothetical protein
MHARGLAGKLQNLISAVQSTFDVRFATVEIEKEPKP